MLSKVITRGEVSRRARAPAAPLSLIRPDRPRPIDRIIDYFGGTSLAAGDGWARRWRRSVLVRSGR